MDFWMVFCGEDDCQNGDGRACSSGIMAIIDPSSCANRVVLIVLTTILMLKVLTTIMGGSPSRETFSVPGLQRRTSFIIRISCLILNGGIAFACISLGLWRVGKSLSTGKTLLPLHPWLVSLFQGFGWLLLTCSFLWSLKNQHSTSFTSMLKLYSFIALLTGVLSIATLCKLIMDKVVTPTRAIDVLMFPGALLIVLNVVQQKRNVGNGEDLHVEGFYKPLNGEDSGVGTMISSRDNITPFAEARFLSKMSFSWLNPLLNKGKEKTLQDGDIPELRPEDKAETCYSLFTEQLSKRKGDKCCSQSSTLSSIFC